LSLQAGTPVVLAPETNLTGGLPAIWQRYSWAISRYTSGKLTSSVPSLSFLPQQVNDENARTAQSVTLTVSDGSQLIIYSIAITSDTGAAGDFASVPPVGAPPPGGSVNVQNGQLLIDVWFLPTAAGLRTAQLTVVHNLSIAPLVIQLSGTGVAAPVPLLSYTPTTLFFDPKKVTTHTVTLTNTGTGPLTIISIAASAPGFTFSTSCNVGPGATTLQPNQSCTVTVGYNFIGPGGSSELVITHNADGSPALIDLEATSKTGPPP
jgi:hypothetical protein